MILHIPPLFIAVADVCIGRHRSALRLLSPSVVNIVLSFIAYVAVFMPIMVATYMRTGFWPYGMLNDLGTRLDKWIPFIVVQFGILSFFAICLWVLVHFTPGFW
eukprot:gnl/TRDRNA2_/TRDRNA2_171681_c0_seq2.p1 gnl/TRDRNA2_/TRDRNA2_171681_c0~~gnl/TRDRNA2_/TRDRNA2_171681_c0_seq2.p1  ORF type:complete len:104 (+),score=12.07 gnl/TRDRNA2_/TRDRNA2_171681_c0_seq2:96-407(+)